ncbi:hypothetical protein D3C74_474750 [compost metagenome]
MIHNGYLSGGRTTVDWIFIVVTRRGTLEANLQLYFITLGNIKVSAHLNLITRSGCREVQSIDQVTEYGK